eukprot:9490434-Pyramimonas_sp.AAC.1
MEMHSPRSAAFLEWTAGGSCLGSPTSTRWPPERMTLSSDMAAISSWAWPASSITSRATGAACLRASADSCVAIIVLASLSSCVRKALNSLEDPPWCGGRLRVL